jgi:anti-sigma B factor antagonist
MDGESRLRFLREKSSLMPGRDGRQRPVPGQALTMRVQREPGRVLVAVAGEIDIATVAQLEEQLSALAAAGDALVADLTQVSFIDAAGIRALDRAAGQTASHHGSVYVICACDHILRLFNLTGLDRRITVARTLTEALQFSSPAEHP